MIVEIKNGLFDGFYETIYCNSDMFYDYEYEDKEEFIKQLPYLNKEDIELEYRFIDFDKYKLYVCDNHNQVYFKEFVESLPLKITDNECFKFEFVKDYCTVCSSKTYNILKDDCYFKVQTNIETLELIKQYVFDDLYSFSEDYLLKEFTSRDGFISFYSNNIDDWINKYIGYYDYNEFSVLFNIILEYENGKDNILSIITEEVYEDICFCSFTEIFVNGVEIYDFFEKECLNVWSKYCVYSSKLKYEPYIIFI